MSDPFVAQKGTAAPAASHPGSAARFHARRTILLPAIKLHPSPAHAGDSATPGPTPPRRAARLTGGTPSAASDRRKFTFRIDTARHAAFCQAAEARNISRQRLLTEALDAFLAHPKRAADTSPPGAENGSLLLPGSAAALPPPL